MLNRFRLVSSFQPAGDQPQAIKKLVAGLKKGYSHQVLLGVTGSGKTFTIAKVIEQTQLPTLIISHNKTLAAQLYQELKEFFPHNPVSFFVSYYDYYQPEAYLPATDTYIAKEVEINPLIDQLRLEATANLFAYPRSIVVASVSCIYNIGAPQTYKERTFLVKVGDPLTIFDAQQQLVSLYYQKAVSDFLPGTFRVRGDRLDIFLAYTDDQVVRLFFGLEGVARIELQRLGRLRPLPKDSFAIYPAKHYLMARQDLSQIFAAIRQELQLQIEHFKKQNRLLEAERIRKRVEYDLKMIAETGYVNGIENYSRYFDGRQPGDPPFSLLDYFCYQFGRAFLVVIDESHVTVPQIRGMYRGDLARKKTLIEFGFRLPSCLDNRPLKFDEFLARVPRAIYVSATPADWEIRKSQGRVVEQLIRPTGLVDPPIKLQPTENQITDLIRRIKKKKKQNQRVLVITLTKRMAEDLAAFLNDPEKTGLTNLKVAYLHADIDTLKRTEILTDLRAGNFDVLVGINLLREGLDLPEVGLVAILDADKQGFLRSKTSLIQIMGRAARNLSGEVVLYADQVSLAMQEAIAEVERRRRVQLEYNRRHHITPRSVKKAIRPQLVDLKLPSDQPPIPDPDSLTPGQRKALIKKLEKETRAAARALEFEKAAQLRDQIRQLEA